MNSLLGLEAELWGSCYGLLKPPQTQKPTPLTGISSVGVGLKGVRLSGLCVGTLGGIDFSWLLAVEMGGVFL